MSDIKHFYIDGDYNPKATMEYRKAMGETLIMSHLGESVKFKQPFNTHSGCFFLNKNQSRMYFESGIWSERDISFHGPLESAATLGVMKKFQIVKPLENGKFLTVEHAGKNMGMVSIEETNNSYEKEEYSRTAVDAIYRMGKLCNSDSKKIDERDSKYIYVSHDRHNRYLRFFWRVWASRIQKEVKIL